MGTCTPIAAASPEEEENPPVDSEAGRSDMVAVGAADGPAAPADGAGEEQNIPVEEYVYHGGQELIAGGPVVEVVGENPKFKSPGLFSFMARK